MSSCWCYAIRSRSFVGRYAVPARAHRSRGAGGAVAAAPPPALPDLLCRASNAAAVAPRVGRPPLDVPARPFRAATPCPAGPRPGAAADRRESDPATSAHPRRAGRARLPGVGQHGVERAAPGRRRTRALARTRTPNAGWARSGANASTGSSSPANDIWQPSSTSTPRTTTDIDQTARLASDHPRHACKRPTGPPPPCTAT